MAVGRLRLLMSLANPTPAQSPVPDLEAIAAGKAHDRFDISLRSEDGIPSVFESMQVVRRVPGRRVVCRGLWKQQPVYAKLFFRDRAVRDAKRDRRGVEALISAHIATPELLHAAAIHVNGMQGEALLFAAIVEGISAEQAWQQAVGDTALRLNLAQTLVVEVARHHAAGLLQRDLYLKNFLLRGEQVYTLDGDGIRPLSRFFGRRQSMQNLALLLSKFDVADEELWLPQLLQAYANAGAWSEPFDQQIMRKLTMQHRRRQLSAYADKKVLRQCTDVQVRRNFRQFMAIARPYLTQGLQQALENPDCLLDEQSGVRLKSGNTCTVGLAEIDGRKVVVKRYNIKNFWHGLGRAFRTSRAAISWSNAHRLKLADIATAPPVSLLERRWGIFKREAYFLQEYVKAPDAAEFFAETGMDADQKLQAAENLAGLFYKLCLLQISHGDFKASNVKMVDGQPALIDLDSMQMHYCALVFQRKHIRDLRRFMRNWQHDSATTSLLTAAFEKIHKNRSLLQKAGIVTR